MVYKSGLSRAKDTTRKCFVLSFDVNLNQKYVISFRFILFGASGGKGSGGMGSSRGAMVRIVLELRKGQEIYMAVGQEGANACVKVDFLKSFIFMPFYR